MSLIVMGLFTLILIGFLFLPWILRRLQRLLLLLRTRLAVILPATATLVRSAFRRAGHQVTHGGELSPFQAAAQIGGALLMLVAGGVSTWCNLELTYATQAALLRIPYEPIFSGSFDQMLGLSTVLLAVVFGLVLTDLLGWTFVTRFALIERGRTRAFYTALICFGMSLLVVVAMALYQVPMGEAATWFQLLPAAILVPLAALLFIGVVFAFCSFEDFSSALIALAVAMGGLGIGVVYIILMSVDFEARLASEGVKSILQSVERNR